MNLFEFNEDNYGLVSEQDIKDALRVLKVCSRNDEIDWGYSNIEQCFYRAFSHAEVDEILIRDIEIHHDWGRRPESDTPIIIAHFENDINIILDGQHRVIVAREQGKKYIKGLVLNFPIYWESR